MHTDSKDLADLLVERAVLRRLYSYCHALDAGDADAVVDCFTATGTFTARDRAGRLLFHAAGREAIRAFARGHTRPPIQHHHHHVAEPMVTPTAEGAATCASRLYVLMEHEGEPVLRTFGTYTDRLVREDDGVWRIEQRMADVVAMGTGLPPFAYAMPSPGSSA